MAFNVLIVDDSPGMRKVIRKMLGQSGFATDLCVEAGDGLEALSVLSKEKVDIVFTDINMPNMNGEELMHRISVTPEYQHLVVLVVSTDRSEERMQRMFALGAKGYVTKPFVPRTLGYALTKITARCA
jgi:two-component system chemotaxis response regulator CheY